MNPSSLLYGPWIVPVLFLLTIAGTLVAIVTLASGNYVPPLCVAILAQFVAIVIALLHVAQWRRRPWLAGFGVLWFLASFLLLADHVRRLAGMMLR